MNYNCCRCIVCYTYTLINTPPPTQVALFKFYSLLCLVANLSPFTVQFQKLLNHQIGIEQHHFP